MLDVCRICLCTGGRMFTMNKYKLQDTFEHITGISLQEDNTLPQMLCTECAQKLSNCGKLRAQSLRANAILTELAIQHDGLTLQVIETIDRNINQLHSNLHTKLYESDHYDYLIEHSDERKDINMADVEIKTERIDEIFLDEHDVFAEEKTLADQGVEDRVSPPADGKTATDSDNRMEFLIKENEYENRLVVTLESVEVKFEPDDGTDIDGSVAECGVVVKQEYPGEDTSIGRQRDHYSEREMYPSCSGWPMRMDSRLDEDNEKETGTGVFIAEHVEKRAKKEQNPLKHDVTDRTEILITATNTENDDDPTGKPKETSRKYVNKECNICLKEFRSSSHLKVHLLVHTGERPFDCKLCGKKFYKKSDVDRHQRVHTGERPYSCNICGKKFSMSGDLKTHVRIHTGEGLYSCETCGKMFTRLGNFKKHMRSHTGEKPYSCQICGKNFALSENLKTHMKMHTGEGLYSCEICGKMFPRLGNLKKHMGSHTGDKPHSCQICGQNFALSDNLKTHMRIHTGEGLYSCEICDKKFTRSGHFKKHMRSHTGDKPYSCQMCDKKFVQNSDLYRHQLIHIGVKPYGCEICGRKFIQNGDLTKHQRIHTGERPYSCELCGKKFNQSSDLNRHQLVHTGEKPYSCEICGKKFGQNSQLDKHQRVHTGEKPYSCEICKKTFRDSSNLKVHIRRQHKLNYNIQEDICE